MGEAESTWPRLLDDAARGVLASEYRADEAPSLEGLPRARRDLIVGRGLLGDTVIATRRSRVRPLQSLALSWGYARAIDSALPGWPIPGGDRGAALDWPRRP